MDDFDDVYTEDENVNLIDILRKAPDGIEKSLSRELVIKILNENSYLLFAIKNAFVYYFYILMLNTD